jgi:hypothetical protein
MPRSDPTNTQKKPSPLRALLWKEWREQRGSFLAMVWIAPALILAERWVQDQSMNMTLVGGGMLLFYLLTVLIGVTAFSGESDGATSNFIAAQPLGRRKLFLGKAMVATLLCLVAQAATLPLLAGTPCIEEFNVPKPILLVTMAGCSLVILFVPAVVSLWARSSIACAFASLGAAFPLLCVMTVIAIMFSEWHSICLGGIMEAPLMAAIAVCFCGVGGLVALTFWIWQPSRKGSLWSGLAKGFSIILATIVLTALPPITEWLWCTQFMTPTDWLHRPSTRLSAVQISKNGDLMLMQGSYRRERSRERALPAILINTQTGNVTWATKGTARPLSSPYPQQRHDLVMMVESSPTIGIMDFVAWVKHNIGYRGRYKIRLMDITAPDKTVPASENTEELLEECYDPQWWNQETAFGESETGITFLNFRAGTAKLCQTPEFARQDYYLFEYPIIRPTGILALTRKTDEPRPEWVLLRYHPDLPSTQVITTKLGEWSSTHVPKFNKATHTLEYRMARPVVSNDGAWAIVRLGVWLNSKEGDESKYRGAMAVHQLLLSLETGKMLHLNSLNPEPRNGALMGEGNSAGVAFLNQGMIIGNPGKKRFLYSPVNPKRHNGVIGGEWEFGGVEFLNRGPVLVAKGKFAIFDLRTQKLDILSKTTGKKGPFARASSPSGNRLLLSIPKENAEGSDWFVWDDEARTLHPLRPKGKALSQKPFWMTLHWVSPFWLNDDRIIFSTPTNSRCLDAINWDGTESQMLLREGDTNE